MSSCVCVFLALLLINAIRAQPVINGMSPSHGTLAGNTRLAIYGYNFGDGYTTSAFVYVGPYPCSVVGHLSSSEVLTCLTSPAPVGTYAVTVVVGEEQATYWGFSYRKDLTPTLDEVFPRAGPAGSDVLLYGDGTNNMKYNDCVEQNWGDASCIGSIMFGDYLCRQDPSNPNTDLAFLSNGLYSIGCTLPAPGRSDTQPALGVAGNVNVTVHFEASLRGGEPVSTPSSYQYDLSGTLYQFQLYAEVSRISPAVGSNAGGTLLEISGSGFPDLSLGLPHSINISIAGVPCTIVNSTYDKAFCVTGPKPAVAPASATPIGGLYAGMRGAEYEYYKTSRNVQYSELWKLNTTITVANTAGSYKTVLTGSAEGLDYLQSYYCSKIKAFFKAPRTTNYSFYLQADDYGQLNATYLSGGVQTKRMLVNLTYYAPMDNWFAYPYQRSEVIPLEAGQTVLLESAHCNNPSIGHQQIGFRMAVPQPQANSMPEVQQIKVAAVQAPRSVLIKYLYGAGSNTTAYTITLAAVSDYLLEDPLLGLEVAFNGGSASVLLPVTATSAEMDNLIEARLGPAFTANASDGLFGVRKLRSLRTLTLQFGIESSQGDLQISSLSLVQLPPPTNMSALVDDTLNCSLPEFGAGASSGSASTTPAGIYVLLSSSPATPAVSPGSFFQLSKLGSIPVTLTFDANTTLMASAIRNLTGYDTIVKVTDDWREGSFYGRVWNVTFPQWVNNAVPDLFIEPVDVLPPGVQLATEVRPANPSVTGSFRLAFGDSCTSVSIGVADSLQTLRAKLASLPGLASPLLIDISSPSSGYTYTITFDPILNPGDQPELRIVDVSELRGVAPKATVTTVRNGSTDAFFAPIPSEFLRLAVSLPGTIDLTVNGVPSACVNETGVCAFQYSDAATPLISSVSPQTLSFSGVSSLPLTITGSGFTADVDVRVGGAVCNVTLRTTTEIVCNVPDTTPAGIRFVTVNVPGLGFAAGAPNVTVETLYVTGSAPASPVLAASGWSILNFTGKGFDSVNCANNKFFIANTECGVLACGSSFLTVLFPGNASAVSSAAQVTVQVFERSQLIDTDTPASPTVQVSASAARISAISPDVVLAGPGGLVQVGLAGVTASAVSAVFVVPEITTLTNFTLASAAYKGRISCDNVTAFSNNSGVSCSSTGLPNGRYHVLVVLTSGLRLLSSDTIMFDFVITGVTPNLGSIGGGTTVTIAGSGFHPDMVQNVVFLTVPVSSTFLNGLIECIPKTLNATHLTCVTQAHMAADAAADDPFARAVLPVATEPRPISVVVCDTSYNSSLLREWCWSMPSTPRARCGATGATSCEFGYSTTLTPAISSVSRTQGSGNLTIKISGSNLQDVTEVEVRRGTVTGLGSGVSATAVAAWCTLPDLPPGAYNLVLKKANGERSVDPQAKGVFKYVPIVLGLTGNVGSLAGGLPLTLMVGGAGVVVGNDSATANAVFVGGLPCPIVSVPGRWQLTCRAPGINGYVYAEYWNLGVSTYSMPNIIAFTQPVVARYERSVSFDLKFGSPAPGVIQTDFFAARYTFYYQIAQPENVTFQLSSDDGSQLYLNDEPLFSQSNNQTIALDPGVHKIVITYVEYTGLAYLLLLMSNGAPNNLQEPQWQKVTPVPPGEALPVKLTSNGIDSGSLCPQTTVTLKLPYQPEVAFEPSQLTLPTGTCAYTYSVQRTPTLASVTSYPSGVYVPPFNSTNPSIYLYGSFLTDPMGSAASQINVTIANETCAITDVSPFSYTLNSLSYTTTRITCSAPPLPVGTWTANIMVDGMGLTRPTASATRELPVVVYRTQVLSIVSPATAGTGCRLSLFGGGAVTVNGYGFVKDLVDLVLGRNMTAVWETCGSQAASRLSATCQAANSSRMLIAPTSSDGFVATFRLSRFTVPNPGALAGNTSAPDVTVRFRPRIYYTYPNNPQYETPGSMTDLSFCGGRTPALSNISPAATTPNGGGTLTLTWALANVGSNLLTATAAGATSNATVELEVGPTVLSCSSVIVTASNITNTTYRETVACQLPAYVPAANYTLWLCIQPFGCGLQPVYSVPLTVSGISATRGSSAGGVVVTVSGVGFDTNSSLVSARFGNSACKITSSSATSLVCETGPLAAKPTSTVTSSLSITPTVGTSEVTFPDSTFTFDPALEATVTSITPARGSTEGGTPVTVTGADFQTGVPTAVTIGGTACTSVVVVNSSAITCTTGKPPSTVLRVPLPVKVMQQGRGFGRGDVSYQYIDLWSRNSTWGGGPVPGFEDSVVIPKGVTVLLDMSPPKLFIIVLEGNLMFDETAPYLNLQAHYIIVKGGNFTIGSQAKPYPGRANITFHGAPNSRDLPMYGAKSLAVREGLVSFYGQPKVPIYTRLNATVDPGATSITLVGAVNWQVGDRIVLASSSFFADEVDEATITALDGSSVPGYTFITLDAPLRFTHLGEIHRHEGVANPLDMRAEVAVLTRNIVLQGDYTSAKNMYGMQIMVSTPRNKPRALVQFDNIEITQSGQAFRLGRYSMHWHMHGDVAYKSWVRGCSIHHTYNRAITIHGTHRAIIQNTLAYNTMGHTFFLEDGIETGNLIEGNIGIYAKTSDALLNTDTTPATFWITNPNNTVRNNVAAGSEAYGYWYRMLDNPEGPSFTTTVCPKFTPLLEFSNNTAHSNMFYGLRIHPEFYPRNVPCNGFKSWLPFEQEPAVFNGLVAYKNGMKGAVGTQVGLVQLTNIVVGDNGGGPKMHVTNGKDHGGDIELSWVVDDRNRYDLNITQMAGLTNATIYARTSTGMRGTAGQWPSCRRIAGVITQSPVKGDPKHSALLSIINTTFVDFTGLNGCTDFSALEHCGKCKMFQGGATSFTAGLKFVSSNGAKPRLSFWSWGHQGIFLDTDGTLINENTLPEDLLPRLDADWAVGPGTTWHSAVESELFDPAECMYVRDTLNSNNGAFCSPALTFRRVLLNSHTPETLTFKDMKLVSLETNRTSLVHFSHYNEDGYQFTVPTGRDYWVTWDTTYRLDPQTFSLHKMDLMTPSHYTYITAKYIQRKNHFKLNGARSNLTEIPPPNSTHGTFSYNPVFKPNSWWWSNRTYNDTKLTVFMAGRSDGTLNLASYDCPEDGCTEVPDTVVDIRNGTLFWSDPATWNTSATNFMKPVLGDNVTIPFGWNLVIDESPPPLLRLTIQGNVSFDASQNINLTATYVLVMGQGALRAGSETVPHPKRVNIYLTGSRDTPDFALDNSLNLGSKTLAAILGGTIELFGRQVNKPWIRLGAPAAKNTSAITVSDPSHGWRVGDKIIITSTTFNVWQSEIRMIKAILNNGTSLLLDSPLAHPHDATIKAYPGGPTVDMRAEVGLISSNILITPLNVTDSLEEKFGVRVVVSRTSVGRFNRVAMHYCGQAGLDGRACVMFDRLANLEVSVNDVQTTVINPSMLNASALIYGQNSNVLINSTSATSAGVAITNNVMYEAFDAHSVDVQTKDNLIQGNLVLGTVKDMASKSGHDLQMPSTFNLAAADNFVKDNVAAGGERYGFAYFGLPCTEYGAGSFVNNTAHSNLAGMWLRAGIAARQTRCTLVQNFTTYMNWDFGIISTRGIPTDVVLRDVNILDTKHSGLTLMIAGDPIDKLAMRWDGGLLAGQSSSAFCAACATMADAGCHQKLSSKSYNQAEPFTPARGLESTMFAEGFAIGPEKKPYDKPMAYALMHGVVNITGVTIADFLGPSGCGGSAVGTYALANHPESPESFPPHYFSGINVVNVANGVSQGMFLHTGPDRNWRNEADCGEAEYTRADGSVIPLNCAGPAHVYWRDLDGTLTGTPGTISGIFPDGPRVFPMDQGTPVLPGPCTYSSITKSYSCSVNSNNFLLDPRLKPNPVPAGGIYGDPQYFVLESRDPDKEDRNFGPVFFNVSGSIDVVVPAMDHGWCFAYTCQKRLSTFWTYVPTGQTVYVNFTGTPSQNFRLWLPYADPNREILVVFNMLYTLNRRFVWLPESGRVMPESAPPKIGDGKPHGSYFWDQGNTLLYVKVKGGRSLETRTENAVMISQSFATTVDQFYNTEERFLLNLAGAMGIDRDRIYTANVVPGSVVVNIGLEPSKTLPVPAIAERTASVARDPSDPVDPASGTSSSDSGSGGSGSGGSGGSGSSGGDTAANNAAVYQDLLAAYQKFEAVILDPNAKNMLGIPPIGGPRANWGNVAVPPGVTPPGTVAPSTGTPPPPPPPPAGTSPGGVGGGGNNPQDPNPVGAPNTNPSVPNPNSAPSGNEAPSTSDNPFAGKGSSSAPFPIVIVIGSVLGGCILAALVAGAVIVVVKRRRAKRTRPVSPPGELTGGMATATASLARGTLGTSTPGTPGGSREAFTTYGPSSPRSPQGSAGGFQPSRQSRLGPVLEETAGDQAASPGTPRGLSASRRGSYSQPQLIQPPVNPARTASPSSALAPPPPLPPPLSPEDADRGPKTPADLGDLVAAGGVDGATSNSMNPGSIHGGEAHHLTYAPTEVAPSGDKWVSDNAEVVRIPEQDSVPPPPIAPPPSSQGPGPAPGNDYRTGTPTATTPQSGTPPSAAAPEPRAPPREAAPMGLPGLAETQSLLSADAAARAVAELDGIAAKQEQAGQQQQGAGSPAVPRSPAGLRSDSMRRQDL